MLLILCFGTANSAETSRVDKFKLFNSCGPMSILVEGLPPDAAEIGLTKLSLRTAVESRLRSARLYDEEVSEWPYLNVNVAGQAFSIGLAYNRWMCHSGDLCGYAKTWEVGSAGTHGKDAGYVRSFVVEHMDSFILEYMKVNEESCS